MTSYFALFGKYRKRQITYLAVKQVFILRGIVLVHLFI